MRPKYSRSLGACVVLSLLLFGVPAVVNAADHPVGGTLVYVRSADSNFLDPGFSTITEDLDVAVNIFDTLVSVTDSNEIVPALAVSWQDSGDKVWTFKLRQGVKFHDGSDFTADDVVFSLARHTSKSPFNYYQGRMSSLQLWTGDLIDSVVAQGDYTVKVTLKRPYALFLNTLASWPVPIVSHKNAEKWKEQFSFHPVGTGPFMLSEWVKGNRLVLVRNPSYWGEGPFLDRIIFKVVPDPSSRILELKTGSGSFLKGVLPDQKQLIEGDPSLQLLVKPSSSIGYVAINVKKPPFDNVLVRRALNYAIDRNAIVKNILGGLGIVPTSMLPPWMQEYNDKVDGYEYNPSKAKALLAQAGYPHGFRTELWTFNVERPFIPNVVQVAEKVRNDLAAVGIQAKLSIMDSTIYWKSINTLQGELAMKGWYTPPQADFLIRVALLGPESATGYPDTAKGQQLVAMAIKASETKDQQERRKLYDQIQETYSEDAPIVPLMHAAYVWAHSKAFKGIKVSPDGLTRFGAVYYSK